MIGSRDLRDSRMTDRPVAVASRALPTVSVIVPCYNHGHFIAQTLESLQRQTGSGSPEAIVVDDDSTDDTAGIVAALAAVDPRIRYVYRPHRGLSAAKETRPRSRARPVYAVLRCR